MSHAKRLRVVPSAPAHGGRPGARGPRVRLRDDGRVHEFLTAAARRGLAPQAAVTLALERHAALTDLRPLRLDEGAIKAILGAAAAVARPAFALGDGEARQARSLELGRPVDAPHRDQAIEVELPERLLTRLGGVAPAAALDGCVVSEMISWQLAATFAGRTLGEWVLATVLSSSRPAGLRA